MVLVGVSLMIQFYDMFQAAERLAWRAANHPVELSGWHVESLNLAAPQFIRAAHDTEVLALKGHVQQPNTRKQAEYEVIHAAPSRAIWRTRASFSFSTR